jgi:hypothetical protein
MKDSEVYRKAAERIFLNRGGYVNFSCWAIDEVVGFESRSLQRNNYEAWFKPEETKRAVWANEWKDGIFPPKEEDLMVDECRIIALCFMAAICESEGN